MRYLINNFLNITNQNKWLGVFLITILIISLFPRFNLNYNIAYMDEATYINTGKLFSVGNLEWPPLSYMFGSMIAPAFFGLGEILGGLIGARIIASFFGLITLVSFFLYVKLLFGKHIAIISTLILTIQAPILIVSKFATYDIVAMGFFSTGLYFFLSHLNAERFEFKKVAFSALFFVMAILTKYVVAIFLPILAIWLWYKKGLKITLIFSSLIIFPVIVFVAYNWTSLSSLYVYQVKSVHGKNATTINLLWIMVQYLGLPLFFSILTFIYSIYKKNKTQSILIAILLIASAPLLFYHLLKGDMISLWKHVAFSLLFLAPLCGMLINELLSNQKQKLQVIGGFCVGIMFLLGLFQLRAMERGYPNISKALTSIKEMAVKSNQEDLKIYSEDTETLRYYLSPAIKLDNIMGIAWYDYNHDGIADNKDIQEIIKNDYQYQAIFLNGLYTFQKNPIIYQIAPLYFDLIYEQEYHTSTVISNIGTGKLQVYWRKKEQDLNTSSILPPEFFADFNNNGSHLIGRQPSINSSYNFTNGKTGSAIIFDKDSKVKYNNSGIIDSHQGAIAFWIKPDWKGAEKVKRILFTALGVDWNKNTFYIEKTTEGQLQVITWVDGNVGDLVSIPITKWKPQRWYHVAFSWGRGKIKLFINGKLEAEDTIDTPLKGNFFHLYLGTDQNCSYPAAAVFDEFIISKTGSNANSFFNSIPTVTSEISFYDNFDCKQDDYDYRKGKYNNGIYIGNQSKLAYKNTKLLNAIEGQIEFEIKPRWRGNDSQKYILFTAYGKAWNNNSFYLEKSADNKIKLVAWVDGKFAGSVAASVANWQPGEWHHVAFSFNPKQLQLKLDDEEKIQQAIQKPFSCEFTSIYIGSDANFSFPANAIFDEIRCY